MPGFYTSLMIFYRVLYNIMANDYVSEDFKDRLRVAARSGRDKQTCLVSVNTIDTKKDKT